MFGIGLPEMLLIMALALIVIGPDKLPDLARSLAKGLLDLKKTAESLKTSLAEEGNPLAEIKPELEEAARSLKSDLLDPQPQQPDNSPTASDPATMAAAAYQELLKQTTATVAQPSATGDPSVENHNLETETRSQTEQSEEGQDRKPPSITPQS